MRPPVGVLGREAGLRPEREPTLIVGFHGHGGSAQGFGEIAKALAGMGFLVALPECGYPLLADRELGFDWFLNQIDGDTVETLLGRHLGTGARDPGVDPRGVDAAVLHPPGIRMATKTPHYNEESPTFPWALKVGIPTESACSANLEKGETVA